MLTITQLGKSDLGEWRSTELKSLPSEAGADTVLWVDAEDPSDAEIAQLKECFVLDELALSELTKPGRRSKIEEREDYVSCFVSFPSRERFVVEAKVNWLVLFMGKKWMVSVHADYSEITCEVYQKIKTHGYFTLSTSPSTDILLYIFLDLITNQYFLVSDLMHERLQSLGKQAAKLFRERVKDANRIIGLEIAKSRDEVLILRQLIGPLREVVGRITRGEFAAVSSSMLSRFEDLYERDVSLIDVADSHREEIHDIGDILINVQTLTTNNIVKVLTIISAIFLPLALIAEIYGTNFQSGFLIPGSDSVYGFYCMVAVMVAIAVALIFVFRRKGWL